MNDRDFSKDVEIDKYKLEEECQKHSGIYYYYNEELSVVKAELDEEKDKLSFMESEFEIRLRENPPEDMKMTEGLIKAYIGSNKVLNEQRQKINDLKKSMYHLEAAVRALEHKKSMLGHLVNLFTMKYYSEPNDKGGGNKEEIDNAIRKNLNRK